MATRGKIQTNLMRIRLVKRYASKRQALKDIIVNKQLPFEERFAAQLKLASLPRNASRVRIRNRCMVTGRARGYFRKFKMSRIALRDMASFGFLPGVTKASW